PPAARTAGQTCSATAPCAAGLSCDAARKVCVSRAANAGTGSTASGRDALTNAGRGTAGSCESACLARCRAACTPSGQQTPPPAGSTDSCTSNEDCTIGYCRIVSSSAMPSTRRGTCVPCTLNSQCGTGKVCIIPRVNEGTCAPLQATGGICNENADCSSNNCASMVTLGAARVRRCAAAVAPASGAISGGDLRITIPTGKAITITAPKLPAVAITPPAARTAGQTCSATAPCAAGLSCDAARKVCVSRAANAGTGSTASGRDALTNAGRGTVGSCESACTETCRLECTPSGSGAADVTGAAGTKAIGELCSGSEGCRTECETGYGECRCEAPATAEAQKKKEGDSCSKDEDCGTGMQCNGFIFGKKCANTEEEKPAAIQAIVPETMTLEAQRQARTELEAVQPQLEAMERRVVEDEFVASMAELIAMSRRPDCYEETDDIELKAECLGIRFETITNILETNSIIAPEQAREWKEKAGRMQAGAEAREASPVVPPPIAGSRGFIGRVRDLFGFTSTVKVTGKATADRDEAAGRDPSDRTRAEYPPGYWPVLEAQYNNLSNLETAICSKYPSATIGSASALKSCTTDAQCGTSGAVKCVTGKCRVKKDDVCTVGEFMGAAASEEAMKCVAPTRTKSNGQACTANAQCTSGYCNGMVRICVPRRELKFNGEACTANAQCVSAYCNLAFGICAIPPGKKDIGDTCSRNAECESELCKRQDADTVAPPPPDEETGPDVTPPAAPAVCSSLSFNIVSVCRGTSGASKALEASGAFVNITLRNAGSADIPSFALRLYELDGSIGVRQDIPLLAAGRAYTQKILYSTAKYDDYRRLRVTPKIGTEQCNDQMQITGSVRTDFPKCNGQICSKSNECGSSYCKQEGTRKICSTCRTDTDCGLGKRCTMTGACQ
ncbi:MAG TPA: hypothetical protein HA362_06895, partial [Nanoarchaeota archaeon]|nr:hypothetical protein [Nanoarchaeota archaeon]